jgi:hypothetical protein
MLKKEQNFIIILIILLFICIILKVIGIYNEGYVDADVAVADKSQTTTLRDWLKNTPILEIHLPMYKDLWKLQKDVLEAHAVPFAQEENTRDIQKFIPQAMNKVYEEVKVDLLRCSPAELDAALASTKDAIKDGSAMKFIECFPTTAYDWKTLANYYTEQIEKAVQDSDGALSGNVMPESRPTISRFEDYNVAAGSGAAGSFDIGSGSGSTATKSCCGPTLAQMNAALAVRVRALSRLPDVNYIRSTIRKGIESKKKGDKIKGSAENDTLSDSVHIDVDNAVKQGFLDMRSWTNFSSFKL